MALKYCLQRRRREQFNSSVAQPIWVALGIYRRQRKVVLIAALCDSDC